MDFDEIDDQAQQTKQLAATQADVTGSNYAEQAGMTGPKSLEKQLPLPTYQADWGTLVKDHPVLAQHMVNPKFAALAKDDVGNLSMLERIFGGWNEMAWKSAQALKDDQRNQRLAQIGHAMKAGTATPDMITEGEDIDKDGATVSPDEHIGLVPGIVPSVVGALPGLARAAPTAAWYGVAGLLGSAALTRNPKAAVGAAGAMAGWGFNVGMAADTARTEEGLSYRQYIKMGAEPKVAAIASDLVALANGGLQLIPAEKVLNVVPGLKSILAGKATKDIVGSLITSNTGKAVLARLALRSQESGLLMGLVASAQELIREVGAKGAGGFEQDENGVYQPASIDGKKIYNAGVGGWQQGSGFGLGHAALPAIAEKREAELGQARGAMYNAIGGVAQESKLLERMPTQFKEYANAVIGKYGKVAEMKVPAEGLRALFQKEGVSDDQVREQMPRVAKQLEASTNGADEIVVPTADLATHLAPLKGFNELAQDIRIGDEITPREAKKVQSLADEYEKNNPAPKGVEEPADPGRKVYNEVYDQLVKAGQAPEVAQKDAALWASFAKARGERMGIDPYEYFKQRAVSVGAEFPDLPGTTLEQGTGFKKWFGGSKAVDENGKPKTMYHGTVAPEDFKAFASGEPRTLDENEGVTEWGSGADPSAYVGSHFAEEPEVASKFARPGGLYEREHGGKGEAGGRVIPVYLKAEKPKVYGSEKEFQSDLYSGNVNSYDVDGYLEDQEDPDEAAEKYNTDRDYREEVNRDLITELSHGDNPQSAVDFARELAHEYKQEMRKQGFDSVKYANEAEGGTSWAVFDPAQIKSIFNKGTFDPESDNVLEQTGSNGYRGKISFDDARSYFNITLTGKANLSTFLHESGHAFFEFLRKDAESGHAGSIEDMGKLREWMGLKEGEEPSTEKLEQFARGFEAYLMEGKAPAPALRDLFRTFGAWLKSVYKGIKSLGVNLTDEVRGVMDRMLATDPEIEAARRGLGLEPMKKPDSMTDAEYAAYEEKFSKAMESGRQELEQQAMREFRSTIGEERAKTQADVEEKTKQDPAHNAYEVLRTGKRLDGGEVSPELAGKKLDREAVNEAGYKGIKWVGITAAEGGIDPEIAAPLLGYKDGPELLEALNGRRSRVKEIKEETDARMAEKYPNADMAKMSEGAVNALHLKDDVGNVLWLEAKALGKQVGQEHPATAKAVVKEIARRRTEDMTALEMQPGRFARGEERAADEWADAMKKKDFAEAHRAKLEQILNHEMFKSVTKAKEEVESIRNYLDKFNELSTRRRLGKAGQTYLNAVDAIIQDVELDRQTNKTLARRASLDSYLREIENEGGEVSIPEDIRAESGLKNYRQMTLNELRAVGDAVANIEHMAQLKNRIFDGRERRALNETAARAAATITANLGAPFAEKMGSPQNPELIGRVKEILRRGAAELKKIEFTARSMDGGQTAGWLHELLFQPFATADAKRGEWTRKVTQELLRPMREMTMKERFALDRTVDFLGTPMKVRDVIAVALNMGNEGNKKKLLDGYAYRGWNEEKVTQRLGEILTDKHLDLVEHFWKTIGSLWPEIKSLSERSLGVAPPQVEPSKLVIRGRELEGGYYPIVYDPKRSHMAEQINQRKTNLFENNFLKPGVSKGFTESRVEYPNPPPIQLSLGIIPSHINEVIHYLTHFEPVKAVDRLVAHPAMKRAITDAMGRETYNLFRPWLQAIAHDGVTNNNTTMVDNILRYTRAGASVTRLGFRVTNTIMQTFNVLSSVKELGGLKDGSAYLMRGMKQWMGSIDHLADPFADVEAQSPEIRGKTKKIEDNLIGNFDRMTSAYSEFGYYKDRLAHFSLSFMSLAWKSVETLTWYAAREKAFDEAHPRPEEYADAVVRMAQMGEGMKDKAAIMRGGEGTKIFTYMYSWYSTIFNQMTETQPQARGGWQKAGELASRFWWMVLAPTVLMSLARGEHSKDGSSEDDLASKGEFLSGEVALESIKAMTGPVGGVIGDTLLSGHDAKFAPWISTVLRGLAVRGKMAAGRGWEDLTAREKKDFWESTGIMGHLPAGAMYNAYKWVENVVEGNLEEPVRDLLLRSPGDQK